MANARERLEKVEITIQELKEKLQNAEKEKEKLLKEIYGSNHNVIDAMPARVRNILTSIGVETDVMLQRFLNGELIKEDINHSGSARFNFLFYQMSDTRKARLMSIRGVGENIADESIRTCNENGI